MSDGPSFFEELKRRHVVRVGVVYAAVAYAVVEGADVFVPALGLPDWILTAVALLAFLGFPIALVLAWAFEATPEGVKRAPPQGGPLVTGGTPEGEAETGTDTAPGEPERTPAAGERWLSGRTVAVVGLLLLVGFGLGAGWFTPPPSADLTAPEDGRAAPTLRVALDFPVGYAPAFEPGGTLALSPDGSRLAFVGVGPDGVPRLLVRPLDRLAVDSVPGSAFSESPFWSPGGDSIAFTVGNEIRVHSLLAGGGSTVLVRDADLRFGGSWSERGEILFASSEGLEVVEVTSGRRSPVDLGVETEGTPYWPHWVPGRRAATFTLRRLEAGGRFIGLARLNSDEPYDSLAVGFNGRVLPSGHLLWATEEGEVKVAGLDVEDGRLEGGSTTVLRDVLVAPGGEFRFTLSRTGTLVYAHAGQRRPQSRVRILERGGGGREVEIPPDLQLVPDLDASPVEPRFAFSAVRGTDHDIWLYDLATGRLDRFTFGRVNINPVWSPAGDRIAYNGFPQGLVVRPSDMSRPARTLISRENRSVYPAFWAAAGSQELIVVSSEGDFLALSPPDSSTRSLGREGPGRDVVLSPDGRWLAYTRSDGGMDEVWVEPFRRDGGPWRLSRGEGDQPVWGPDGGEIFFRTRTAIMVAEVDPGETFSAGEPRVAARISGGNLEPSSILAFDVLGDGERFVIVEGQQADVETLVLETHWLDRLGEEGE